MTRTYPYDHFMAPGHSAPVRPEEEKGHVSGAPGRHVDRHPHYGRRFAETEDLAQARQKGRQLEELARERAPKLSRPREPERPRHGPEVRAPVFLIGALPPDLHLPELELPDLDQPEWSTLGDLLEQGRRHLRLLHQSIQDGAAAGLRLLALPLEVARLVARSVARLRPAKVHST